MCNPQKKFKNWGRGLGLQRSTRRLWRGSKLLTDLDPRMICFDDICVDALMRIFIILYKPYLARTRTTRVSEG